MVALKSTSECNIQTPEEVAQFLRKSPSWVYKHWQELGGRKLGGSLLFPTKEDLYERIFYQGQGVEVRSTPQRNPLHQGRVQNQEIGQRGQSKKKEELTSPNYELSAEMSQTALPFLGLTNLRLDHVKAYNSESHYNSYKYQARRWVKKWGNLTCDQISQAMTQQHLLERRKISAYAANKELRYLRATWNFWVRLKLVSNNPTDGIEFFPVEKKVKYVPSAEDLDKVIACADTDTQDYLWVIRETMGQVSEINRLTWDDVDLADQSVTLYTRKKKGGHLTPRRVPMAQKLH